MRGKERLDALEVVARVEVAEGWTLDEGVYSVDGEV